MPPPPRPRGPVGPARALASARSRVRDGWSDVTRHAARTVSRDDAHDIELARQRLAVESSARYVDEQMPDAVAVVEADPVTAMLRLIREATEMVGVDGLTVEFGVATGLTLREIASCRTPAYGFDSFEGLPEDWRPGYAEGHFAQEPPHVDGAELVIGWFDQTLPLFLAAHPEPWAFVHLDADLYSSTKTVLDLAFDRFRPGTVIVFDEYFNYPGWQHHEHRAFMEFLERWPTGFRYRAYNATHEQVTVELT